MSAIQKTYREIHQHQKTFKELKHFYYVISNQVLWEVSYVVGDWMIRYSKEILGY